VADRLINLAGEDFPDEEKDKRWPKLAPLRIKIPERPQTAGSELTSPSPGSPIKEYVEFFKRMSRDVSSDSMFPDEMG
jgi:hypothetical protein